MKIQACFCYTCVHIRLTFGAINYLVVCDLPLELHFIVVVFVAESRFIVCSVIVFVLTVISIQESIQKSDLLVVLYFKKYITINVQKVVSGKQAAGSSGSKHASCIALTRLLFPEKSFRPMVISLSLLHIHAKRNHSLDKTEDIYLCLLCFSNILSLQ